MYFVDKYQFLIIVYHTIAMGGHRNSNTQKNRASRAVKSGSLVLKLNTMHIFGDESNELIVIEKLDMCAVAIQPEKAGNSALLTHADHGKLYIFV